MKTVMIPWVGGPEVIAVADVPIPAPGPGQVSIRVRAATVNPTDLGLRAGLFQAVKGPPYIPGMELAGTVEAIGPGRSSWQVGDGVIAMVVPTRPEGGAQAEVVVVDEASLARVPRGSSWVEAATLPMNGLTVRLALDLLALPRGSTLAVTGAPGAVGGYAIQLGRAAGLRVVADSGPGSVELIRRLGAEIVVERGPHVAQAILRHIPDGVDALLDASVQGAEVLAAVRNGGQVASVRPFQGETERNIVIRQVSVGDYVHNHEALEQLVSMVESGELTLRVAATFPPERAGDAHRRLEAGSVLGRLVIVF